MKSMGHRLGLLKIRGLLNALYRMAEFKILFKNKISSNIYI